MVDQSIRFAAGTDPGTDSLRVRTLYCKMRRKIHSVSTLLYLVLLLSSLFSSTSSTEISDNEVFDDDLNSLDEASKGLFQERLEFTQEVYDVVIPENSLGRVYAVPSDLNTKMGIALPKSMLSGYNVRFRIKSGDEDGFFKAEADQVGDFVFLLIRTRTNTLDVLNRERRDSYELEIRTRIREKQNKNRRLKSASAEASTIVRVTVKDVNDLDPFFSPSTYAFVVPEDTPLHQVCNFRQNTQKLVVIVMNFYK